MPTSFHQLILTSSPEGRITVYDAYSGTVVTHFASSRSPRRGLTLVGNTFIAVSHVSPVTASASIHLYNWWSSTAFHNLPVPEPVAPLSATPDGLYLFAGGLSGCVYSLSVPSGDILTSISVHEKPVSCLHITDDGSLLISGGEGGTIVFIPIFQLVGPKTGDDVDELIWHKFVAHSGEVTAITSGKGLCNSQVITSSSDCTCKFWSLLRGTHLRTVVFPCPITGLVMSPSESEFFAAGSDGLVYRGTVRIGSRNLKDQQVELSRWSQSHNGSIVSLAMSNNGTNLVSASEDGSVWVWRADQGQVVLALGTEMGSSISDLIVVNGTSCKKDLGLRLGRNEGGGGIGSRDLTMTCSFPVKETMEMQSVLAVAEKDRSRAIDMLESAIAMYERLLELILKEAKGTRSTK